MVLTLTFALVGVWLPSLVPMLKGEPHSDPSIVDRLWNIQPWVYCWHFYLSLWYTSSTGVPNHRLLVMSVLATVWGLRITYNFYIKGGFSGGEDYRWGEIRKWYPGVKYEVFNLVFVCLFQQCEILAFSTPAVV